MLKEKLADPKASTGNRYNLMEAAGAFGDLGTLVPFIIAYISIVKINPTSILLVFGIFMIACGLYYKTPIPVQPMKAIGAVAITQAGINAGMVWWAGLFTGLFWLAMVSTNFIKYVAKLASKPVITGIILGLGLSFIREAAKLMLNNPLLAVGGLILTFLMLRKEKIPAVFILLCLGIIYTLVSKPGLINDLANIKIGFQLPEIAIFKLTTADWAKGLLLLALPQIPLTIGNGVLAITAENNELFPEKPVTARKISLSTGLMNIVSTVFGGVPVCHGAGGMAGHVRFGARTGGSLVILGVLLTILGLFFGSSVLAIFNVLPKAILGVILFFAGWELVLTLKKFSGTGSDAAVVVVTAVVSLYNAGLGFLAGLVLYYIMKIKTQREKREE